MASAAALAEPPGDVQGAPKITVTGYDVHYTASFTVAEDAAAGSDASTAWVAVTHTGTTASQSITSLSNDTAYRVRVRAKSGNETGAWAFGRGTPVNIQQSGGGETDIIAAAGVQVSATALTVAAGNSATYTVQLSAPGDVVVNLAVANSATASVSPFQLVFSPGNWNQPKTVTMASSATSRLRCTDCSRKAAISSSRACISARTLSATSSGTGVTRSRRSWPIARST